MVSHGSCASGAYTTALQREHPSPMSDEAEQLLSHLLHCQAMVFPNPQCISVLAKLLDVPPEEDSGATPQA